MIIQVEGQSYDIVNWDEFRTKLLTAIGFLIENEIRALIREMRLVDGGYYINSIGSKVEGDALIVFSTAPYSAYLEFGTLTYFDIFGVENFPKTPDPKKKHLSKKEREAFPKGMQPFAPFRKVLTNSPKMQEIIVKAAKSLARQQ